MPNDTLTQEQIDALFHGALGTDNEKEDQPEAGGDDKKAEMRSSKKYIEYNFKNPKILTKDHLRIINLVHENYAKYISSFLSSILRTECVLNVNLDYTDELKYYEYSNALPPSLMLGVFELNPIEGAVIIVIQKETCYTIIDRLLGGSGESVYIPDDFSDIELKILEGFCQNLISYFESAWKNLLDVEPKFIRIETNSRLSQIMPLEESIFVVPMSIKIMDHESTISICLPCLSLEEALGDTTIYMVNNRRKNLDPEANKKTILTNLKTSKVDIRGILGTTNITLQDLLQIQVGDIIDLDIPVETPVVLKIGSKDWFDGEVGVKKNKIAVKIKNVLQYINMPSNQDDFTGII